MNNTVLKIKKLNPQATLPNYQTNGSSGIDLMAELADSVVIKPGEAKLIKTGIAIALADGFEAQVRPRSGLALKHSITVLNTPGTIDSDYRGEVAVILINHGREDFTVTSKMRIAQLVITRYAKAELIEVEDLDETLRGKGGFGSTGV